MAPNEEVADMNRNPRPRRGPLSGIRVADFCWMGVGSIATRVLADFGAEVIKIESRTVIDRPRRHPIYKNAPARTFGEELPDADPNLGGMFNNYCRNKLGVTIDMRQAAGRELAERLIASSSIVTENFAPGVMERWGLTYDRLKELKPDVIYARMSGYGHFGPHANYRSYGPVVQGVSGLSFISGLPGREPSGWGYSYMDNQAGYYNSASILAAIYNRNLTGEGTEIDVSAVEVGISLVGPLLLDVTVNKRPSRRKDFPTGNRLESQDAAPHGVYPALGIDRWVAISVFNDHQWTGFVEAIGSPEWTSAPQLSTQASRSANQDLLDRHVAAWTSTRDRHQIAELLQGHGVPAGAVQSARDIDESDPQSAHRAINFELDHPVIGPATFEGNPMQFSNMAADNWRSAPLLGEDNEYVFRTILGLTADEYLSLQRDGVV
jgi:crotonobetainyl-CoA:carnitine CoA-transferase CaiB-like acyl-CoA transferase